MIDSSSSLKSENNYKMAESIYDKLLDLISPVKIYFY